ncbi:patatin-like phospholipase family protein [Rhodoblastus acidophilus]|uniref:Patatin-like phospholipase family protein n=1 Tax=Candidatus Rhodoblastus alkanivorans TaxID=2954117 RepID=A0ABS9Z6X3_9HYPH|nr:patatin-like phospholipase family protein [Candidatus Rhodoblastus alkanivorans]MCI4679134.1 patatin-like phospholipase family protein [Candidatus Rhodoblastus alkanivorans]MCI4683130.1 patatin-like phospholipase family protein [Candidatus Rhodoblastus alkanivorans]MDI4640441.1 patatin-like phospholipase family protein [Rhodoblastus acidophilus]
MTEQIPRPAATESGGDLFKCIALVLQGGGALGSYQAGVYEALAEANIHPDWVAGISIGSINSALIAGNPPEKRVEKLREFWETVTEPPLGPFGLPYNPHAKHINENLHRALNQFRAFGAAALGATGFFKPRVPSPLVWPEHNPSALGYYDVSPLKSTLERLVDFDRINSGATRLSVGAVNVRTGNFTYFDTKTHRIDFRHIMASGSLPPGFPATEIDGEFYWDGGIVSNTPLQWVLESHPRRDTLTFQVDLWSATGDLPRDLAEVETRQKDIQYSSRTREATHQVINMQRLRRIFRRVYEHLPEEIRALPEVEYLAKESNESVYNIVHLIYHAKSYEGVVKDFEFSRRTMEEHWSAGYSAARKALGHPEVLRRPHNREGFCVFDFSHEA